MVFEHVPAPVRSASSPSPALDWPAPERVATPPRRTVDTATLRSRWARILAVVTGRVDASGGAR